MNQASTFLLNDTTMLGPSAIPLSIQMGRDERLVGPGGVPFPDARERRLPRMVFADGWKAQGLDDDHALVLWVELTQDLPHAHRADSGWA